MFLFSNDDATIAGVPAELDKLEAVGVQHVVLSFYTPPTLRPAEGACAAPDVRRAVFAWAVAVGSSAAVARRARSVPGARQRGDAPADAGAARRAALRAVPADGSRRWRRSRRPSSADVLRAWENLGYNRRALNLWRAARAVVERGGVPADRRGARQTLPGVGPYTARAVASFAFDVDVAAADVNVRRVVARLHGVSVPAARRCRRSPTSSSRAGRPPCGTRP